MKPDFSSDLVTLSLKILNTVKKEEEPGNLKIHC